MLHRRPLAVLAVLGLLVGPAFVASPAQARPTGEVDQAASARPPATTGSVDLATAKASRWIVQLDSAPLAERNPAGDIATTRAVGGGAGSASATRLDLSTTASQAGLAAISAQQDQFTQRLLAAIPKASVQRSYQVVVNGMSVAMSGADAARVRAMAGVKAVTPDIAYHADMYATPAQIGAPAAWTALGGQATAGSGVKVAIIDSGIFVTKDPGTGAYTGNPCFDDTSYGAPPAGFPKGDTRFTNNKVLVARTYFRPSDPPVAGEETAVPGPGGSSHGTHVSGTVACDANTSATVSGTPLVLSGIAPHAYLMNYKVFYNSVSPEDFQNGNAYTTELVAAIEDAVKDGADVVSSSWGSSYQNTLAWPDPMVKAAESAVDAGVTMVFAQGNEGPDPETGNLPSGSPKVIAVGAVTKNTTISPGHVDATDSTPATITGSPFDVGPAQFGPQDPTSVANSPFILARNVAASGSSLGCSLAADASPFPSGSMTGKIAVIQRGTCDFSEKVFNAQRGGAIAAFVYNSAAGGDNLQAMGPGAHATDVTIPSFFLRRSDGLALDTAGTGNASYTKAPHAAPNVGDVVAGFSSRGPSADKTIKPDLAAPGVDVVSSGYNGTTYPTEFTGFGSASGTSMATPHVAGSAALLKALHPTWTPAQIKSALMSTATEAVSLTTTHDNSAGVLDRGAGRIDLNKAIAPGLTFDTPSVSGGERKAGTSQTTTITATNVGSSAGTWNITPVPGSGLVLSASPASITVPAGGTATFNVTIGTAAATAPSDHQGSVRLTNASTSDQVHIPVWLRVVVDAPTTDVLLVDDDGSSADPSFADYSARYTALLTAAHVSFDYLDVWNDGFPALSQLEQYRSILMFTGNNNSFDTSGFDLAGHDRINAWLDSGGKLLATGQNLAEVTDDNTFTSAKLGRARLYHGYLGLEQDSPSAFPAGVPRPAGTGTGLLNGMSIDLTAGGDGAGNQTSVEATSPLPDNDTFQAADTMSDTVKPAPGAAAPPGTALGHIRSSEPSLEQPRLPYLYRSLSFGFGLEGVRGDAGGTSAQAVTNRSLAWILDDLTASINPGTYRSAEAVTLTATAASNQGAAITKYRWDFGDGSPIATTTDPLAEHRYKTGGTYPVRLEVTDALGHRIIATRAIAVATGFGYRLVGVEGGVFSFGEKRFFGSAAGLPLGAPIVGSAASPTGRGYWLVGGDGGVFSYGDAGFFGSTGGMLLNKPIVGMATTPTGKGYWLVASDGGIFSFGDATFFGSAGGTRLNKPVVGMAASPTGQGYWLVASDGGIFGYGDAGFFGSAGGLPLNKPVVGMAPSPTGRGYWLAATDGGVFTYGDAGFFGSAGGLTLQSPVTSIASSPSGLGYWLAGGDGGVFSYGDALFDGSAADVHPSAPIVSITGG